MVYISDTVSKCPIRRRLNVKNFSLRIIRQADLLYIAM